MINKSNPHVLARFQGREGKRRIIEALQNQELVSGNLKIATELSKYAQIQFLKERCVFIKQGNSDTDIYFILGGSVSIEINGRVVANRKAGEHVGEMALLDTTSFRTATVRTLEKTVVVRITEVIFTRIANQFPGLWRKIAVVLAKRLTERNKFHPTPHSQSVVFIGSSNEGLEIAKVINRKLSAPKHSLITNLWTNGVFELSKTTIEDLIRITKQVDFAVLVITPDDLTESRKAKNNTPRDNVVFELGLFMGALSRERTYIVMPENTKIKMPSDLSGVNVLLYAEHAYKNLASNLAAPVKKLIASINGLGPI